MIALANQIPVTQTAHMIFNFAMGASFLFGCCLITCNQTDRMIGDRLLAENGLDHESMP